MTGAEFVQGAFRELHRTLLAEMQPLTQDHLGWRPSPEGNPVGAIFWHFMRTEDGIVHRMQGNPPRFESEGWSEKAGLGGDAQSAALSQNEADRVARIPKDRMLAYAEAVIESAKAYTESLTDAVGVAYGLASPGGTVLLAPACASLDMFRDYAERGRVFTQAVAQLEEDVGREA